MSRRRRRDWSASGLPHLRDAWTRALSSELGRHGRDLDAARAHGDQAPAEVREAVRVYDATLPAREALIEHTSRAELYWVTAPMVDLATESALSLPAWTPTAAVPCDAGLLCWQRPATTHLPHPDGGTCTWDAVLWCPHPVADHALLVQALTRTPGGDLPLTPVVEVHVPLGETRRPDRADAGELVISALGAAWLLMGQPAVTELTVDAPGAAESGNERRGRSAPVTIVDVAGMIRDGNGAGVAPGVGDGGREYTHRWWVSGHWRQQPYGPGRRYRKPVWIAPHLKGPPDAPVVRRPRVNVWRGHRTPE